MQVTLPAGPTSPAARLTSRHIILSVLFLILATPFALAAPAALSGNPLADGYHDLYNLDFAGGHRNFQLWMTQHPEDPMGPVSDAAASLFSEFDRLHVIDVDLFADQSKFDNRQKLTPDPAVRKVFDDRTDQADKLADAALKRNPKDATAFYVKTLVCGMRSDYALMIDKRDISALNLSKQASAYSKQALAIDPNLYDAYLATGVENYMLSLKWAPLRWLLSMTGAGTNREEGIRLLRLTATKGYYLAPFARMMLAVAALRDNRPQEAKDILASLSKEYPQNSLYQRELARIH